MKADIVVFDPQTVGTKANLKNPNQLPTGIHYVLVNGNNGKLVIDQGKHTGATPGGSVAPSPLPLVLGLPQVAPASEPHND